MRIRAALAASVLSTLLLLATAVTAFATETWCDVDPPVLIRTPGGHARVVYVVSSGPTEHLVQLLLPTISYETHSVASGDATQVKLDVTVRDTDGHRHTVRSEVWSGPVRTGRLLSVLEGQSGSAMRHQFRLDVP
jgi:ribosomal protein S28E/S33